MTADREYKYLKRISKGRPMTVGQALHFLDLFRKFCKYKVTQ